MNYKHLGQNIQTVRKLKKMTQQELADAIGINLQSLSKIERGVNYPTLETLEKIMEVLEVTPNELLKGTWKYASHIEKDIIEFLKKEERLNVELKHGHYDNFFDTEEEWIDYELKKIREYIIDYINSEEITASDIYPIKDFIQNLKFKKILERYDDFYSIDMFGESIEGHKHMNPYFPFGEGTVIINTNYKENRKILSQLSNLEEFNKLDDLDDLE